MNTSPSSSPQASTTPPRPSPRNWPFVVCDSLEKVFQDEAPRPMNAAIGYSVFLGETAEFQIAFEAPDQGGGKEISDGVAHPQVGDAAGVLGLGDGAVTLEVTVDDDSARWCRLSRVINVACPAVKQEFDEHYLRTASGHYPDLLEPMENGRLKVSEAGWHAVWVHVRVDEMEYAGPRPVTVEVAWEGEVIFEQTVLINVLPRQLPPLHAAHTEWFHCDALADYYRVPVFSEKHWEIIDRFMASAAAMDVNMILTPLWTPPLDTAVGAYRTPVQLIEVTSEGGRYSFDFSRLVRWMSLCRSHGISQLEMSHFFSQWGAKATPAIYATVDGERCRIFGWDVPASDPRYREFLQALIPQLLDVLAREWDLSRVVFHISDEPHGVEQCASYEEARAVVAPLLGGLRMIDALSDLEYYTRGLVQVPVVADNHIAPFIETKVDPKWVYYCVSQQVEVTNRFITLPSVRSRILAPQMFKENIRGFLHWGFNFYYSELSVRLVDPFHDTTAGGAFPGGDPFVVYPGPDGVPWESIRYRVLAAAMADIRAMEYLEELRGREAVLAIVDPEGDLAFDSFSYDPDSYRRMREAVNTAIMAA